MLPGIIISVEIDITIKHVLNIWDKVQRKENKGLDFFVAQRKIEVQKMLPIAFFCFVML
jgi:hypothetical protein